MGTSEQTDKTAEIGYEYDIAECRDCDQKWEGSAVEQVAEAHAAEYDHRVSVAHQILFSGIADE